MKQPPSNAHEVPLYSAYLTSENLVDIAKCDACKQFATCGDMTRYTWPHERHPAKVLPPGLRITRLWLCRGCEQAYGQTVKNNGYILEDLES
jgi:hypothetical protein